MHIAEEDKRCGRNKPKSGWQQQFRSDLTRSRDSRTTTPMVGLDEESAQFVGRGISGNGGEKIATMKSFSLLLTVLALTKNGFKSLQRPRPLETPPRVLLFSITVIHSFGSSSFIPIPSQKRSHHHTIIIIITMPTVAAPPVPQIQNTTDHEIESPKKNRIQVSNTKKPLFFYVNLAKRYIQQRDEVVLSALGMAITTVVTIAEILKNNGLAIEKKVSTSSVSMKDENKGRLVQKAKIEIVLEKSEKFDTLMAPTNNIESKRVANENEKK
ncbi:unnamed protein product [Sphenostylis stenocarpa]|uniref:DNA/RNA-binding protein Alba-like domain-containing protein n=1 Tax=Sphenostylis stenocarpa TaxID=92480 RepID=A0AA86VZ57_9FABA|nr:unnamed protein product [Sphenostylis stenocarpa]